MFADLHLHTRFSDGTYSPAELAGQARQQGLSAIALTDHDTVEGCRETDRACRACEIEFIPGTELTAEHCGNEVHLLGLFIDDSNPLLLRKLAQFQQVRQQRIQEMVARLNALGIALQSETVFALANCQSPGRPHVGRALVEQGFCASMDEAFDRLLKKNRPAWVPKHKMSALEAMELIHQADGIAAMAHPALNQSDEIIPDLVEAGLDAIECFHSKHSPAAAEHYLRVAEKYCLGVTGGSDCHGMSKGRPLIGTVKLPWHFLADLKQKHAAQRGQRNKGEIAGTLPPAARS